MPTRVSDRLIAELVRRREESLGHPSAPGAADAQALDAPPALEPRIIRRACSLPGAEADRRAIRRAAAAGRLLFAAVGLFGAVSGALAASAALAASRPASLPLLLFALVGANLLMLGVWLVTLLRPAAAEGLPARALRRLWTRSGSAAGVEVVEVLLAGRAGRWLLACASHLGWLAFSCAAWLALLMLLSLRAYTLSWETTLLTPDALQRWAAWLSFGPRLLGIGVHDIEIADARAAGELWSRWLLAALAVYGIVPRALALLVSALALRHAWSRWARDMRLPGFARLRDRLLPDHRDLGVVDAPPAAAAEPPVKRAPPAVGAHPSAGTLGFAFEADERVRAQLPDAVAVRWLGVVDDAPSRQRVLAMLRDAAPTRLAIVVRGRASPDRGSERFLADAVAAAGDAAVLYLAGLAAGEAPPERWRVLAGAAGISELRAAAPRP